jgi:hypothetical protein
MCHTVQGTLAQGKRAPDLTHLAGRQTLAAGTLPNTPQQPGQLDRRSAEAQAGTNMPATPMSPKTCSHRHLPGDPEMSKAAGRTARSRHRPSLKDGPAGGERVARRWTPPGRDPPGFFGWFCAINHKTIARASWSPRWCSSRWAACWRRRCACSWRGPNTLMGPDLYNQVFTMHGTTMMFLFAVPVMQAMAVYLVPLMVGARSVAFPRMNAYAYWIFLFGGLMLYIAFAAQRGPDAGWFAYVPLAGPDYSPASASTSGPR